MIHGQLGGARHGQKKPFVIVCQLTLITSIMVKDPNEVNVIAFVCFFMCQINY